MSPQAVFTTVLPVTKSHWAELALGGGTLGERSGLGRVKPHRRTGPRDFPSQCPGRCWPLSSLALALLGSSLRSCLPVSPEPLLALPVGLFLLSVLKHSFCTWAVIVSDMLIFLHVPCLQLPVLMTSHLAKAESLTVPAEERKARPQDGKELIFLFNEIVFHPCVSSLQSPWA